MSELDGPWVCSVCGSPRIEWTSIQPSLGDLDHPLGLCWECRGTQEFGRKKDGTPIAPTRKPAPHPLSPLCRPDEYKAKRRPPPQRGTGGPLRVVAGGGTQGARTPPEDPVSRHQTAAVVAIGAVVYDWMLDRGYMVDPDEGGSPVADHVEPWDAIDLLDQLERQGFDVVERPLSPAVAS